MSNKVSAGGEGVSAPALPERRRSDGQAPARGGGLARPAVQWSRADAKPIDPDRPGALHVREHLRKAILRGEFPPSAPISQVQLARQLGISRTPLREALRMLEAEGLVTSQANRMVRITPMSVADLEGTYAVRIVVEALGVKLSVPRFTEEDLADLEAALADLDEASTSPELDPWEACHRRFHHLIRKHAGKRLDAIAQSLSDDCGRYRRLYLDHDAARLSAAAREHREVFDAASQRDATLASQLIARHLGRTALTDAASIEPERDPALVREALLFALGSGDAMNAKGGA